ncbi:MAG TPA: LysM peptidoglycan-binding domain-containing protein [Bacteroidales bacterium]|nr:LysM peptidoglycan-binding domain-containing protein [Bacteroidales bacterium]
MSEKQIISALVLFFVLLAPVVVIAQEPVPVEISSQKVVAEGKVWFMHKVMKGQTLYSISKAYTVTVNDITGANIIPENGIQEGQILKIPAPTKGSPDAVKTSPAPVKTQAVEGLTSSRQIVPVQQQDERFIYHRVSRGETLSSLSRQYGIPVRDLKKANKGLLYPREGEYLMIPRNKIPETRNQKKTEPAPDTVRMEVQIDSTIISDEADVLRYIGETSEIKDLKGSVRVEVMLPFYLNENSVRSYIDSSRQDSKGKKIYKEVIQPDEWIYEASLPFIEMYEGMLIAVDSLRSMGLEVELNVSDTGADSSAVDRLISSGRLRNADLIIGPVYSFNLERIAAYAEEYDIPVVSPVQLRDQNVLEGNPTLFRVCPSTGVAQDIIVREVATHPGSNVIFMYSDSLMIYPQTSAFWEKLTTTLRNDIDTGGTLLTSHYYTGFIPRNDTYRGVATLETLMKSDRENIIILVTTLTPKVSAAFSTLHTLSRRYKIKVFGYPEIGTLETIDLRYYYDLELMIPSESYIDYTRPSTEAFLKMFRKKYMTEPPAESFAWRGFDMAYYFIGGLAYEGRSFIKRPWRFNPMLLSHDFGFSRDNTGDGFENRNMFLLQYKKDMTVTVTMPWEGTEKSNQLRYPWNYEIQKP